MEEEQGKEEEEEEGEEGRRGYCETLNNPLLRAVRRDKANALLFGLLAPNEALEHLEYFKLHINNIYFEVP